MIVRYAWFGDKKMKPCPFCGKKHTDCTIETTDITTVRNKPVFDAVIECLFCGCTVHNLDSDQDVAVKGAREKWEHRAGDEE